MEIHPITGLRILRRERDRTGRLICICVDREGREVRMQEMESGQLARTSEMAKKNLPAPVKDGTRHLTEFAKRLKHRRLEAGLTEQKLSERTFGRVGVKMIRRLERGEPINVVAAARLSYALEVPLEWLILGEPTKRREIVDNGTEIPDNGGNPEE